MDYRGEFADFGETVYLNCANQGPFPRVTAAAIEEAVALKSRPDRIRDDIYFRIPNEIRSELALLLGGSPADYAITNGASDGIFAVARGLRWQTGDEVLGGAGDFPANYFAWSNLASAGVSLRVLPANGGPVTAAQFIDALGKRTRVVSVSLVSYTSGYRIDIEALGRACRENSTLLVVDITQAAGALELNLQHLPIDVAVCAAYKWLLSPYGTGFAWFHPDVIPGLRVTDVYWQAVQGAEDFNRLPRDGWRLSPGARRFDSTETASFLNGSAMLASLKFLRRIGVTCIERHVTNLLDRLLDRLPASFQSATSLEPCERSGVLGIAGKDALFTRRGFETLLGKKIIVSLRDDRIRVSPHIYNTEEEMSRCAQLLALE